MTQREPMIRSYADARRLVDNAQSHDGGKQMTKALRLFDGGDVVAVHYHGARIADVRPDDTLVLTGGAFCSGMPAVIGNALARVFGLQLLRKSRYCYGAVPAKEMPEYPVWRLFYNSSCNTGAYHAADVAYRAAHALARRTSPVAGPGTIYSLRDEIIINPQVSVAPKGRINAARREVYLRNIQQVRTQLAAVSRLVGNDGRKVQYRIAWGIAARIDRKCGAKFVFDNLYAGVNNGFMSGEFIEAMMQFTWPRLGLGEVFEYLLSRHTVALRARLGVITYDNINYGEQP